MKKIAALCLAFCLLLCGCANLFDGSYVSVTPHKGQINRPISQTAYAQNYSQLCQVLEDIVHSGTTESLISAAGYYEAELAEDVERAVISLLAEDPIAAYAVKEINYEIGTTQSRPAVVVMVSYTHDRTEIQKIQTISKEEDAKAIIAAEMGRYSTGVVLYGNEIGDMDYTQWVEDYGSEHPETMMEIPEVTINLYPENGPEQVVELKFHYQNSREVIREMQEKVETIFTAAALHASGGQDDRAKYTRLYALLMESFESYTLETSITPAYSLLIYGVGDSKAFADVYSAMCRQLGLECITIGGTRMGEAWHWNMVKVDGVYYHLDLLGSHRSGGFQLHTDDRMSGYVWDYSAYPIDGVSN